VESPPTQALQGAKGHRHAERPAGDLQLEVQRRFRDGRKALPISDRTVVSYVILQVAVLGGELAVPCTRNPLQRG
jgi:hypothetical protein